MRPAGTRLDLNGVVKAMAVDDAAALLDGPGSSRPEATSPRAASPSSSASPAAARSRSSTAAWRRAAPRTRHWLRGGKPQHHLIDPRTRRPSTSPWTAVTAVGRDCLAADVAAKAGFLLGANGPAWLDERGVAARFVAGGAVVANDCWLRSVEREGAWA